MLVKSDIDRTEQVEFSPFRFFKKGGNWPKEKATLPMRWRVRIEYWRSLRSVMMIPILTFLLLIGRHSLLVDLFILALVFISFLYLTASLWRKRRFGEGVITLSSVGFQDTRLSEIFIPWSACSRVQLSGDWFLKTATVGEVVILSESIPDLERQKFYGFSLLSGWGASLDRLLFIEFPRDWTSREMFAVHGLITSLVEKSRSP